MASTAGCISVVRSGKCVQGPRNLGWRNIRQIMKFSSFVACMELCQADVAKRYEQFLFSTWSTSSDAMTILHHTKPHICAMCCAFSNLFSVGKFFSVGAADVEMFALVDVFRVGKLCNLFQYNFFSSSYARLNFSYECSCG